MFTLKENVYKQRLLNAFSQCPCRCTGLWQCISQSLKRRLNLYGNSQLACTVNQFSLLKGLVLRTTIAAVYVHNSNYKKIVDLWFKSSIIKYFICLWLFELLVWWPDCFYLCVTHCMFSIRKHREKHSVYLFDNSFGSFLLVCLCFLPKVTSCGMWDREGGWKTSLTNPPTTADASEAQPLFYPHSSCAGLDYSFRPGTAKASVLRAPYEPTIPVCVCVCLLSRRIRLSDWFVPSNISASVAAAAVTSKALA